MSYESLISNGQQSAILFTGATCGPCKRLKPRLEAMAQQTGLQLHVLDIANEMPAVRALGIRGVPSMVASDGQGGATLLFTGELHDEAIARKLRDVGLIGG